MRLASVNSINVMLTRSCRLQFEFRGRTSTLKSPSEIAAWIAERKKRFPTKARAEEAAQRRIEQVEARKAANKARMEAQDKERAQARDKGRLQQKSENKRKERKEHHEDAEVKAKRKVEKLRRKLAKVEERVAKAAAKASEDKHTDDDSVSLRDIPVFNNADPKRKRSDSVRTSATDTKHASSVDSSGLGQVLKIETTHEDKDKAAAESAERNEGAGLSQNPIPDPLTPMSQPSAPDELVHPKEDGVNGRNDAASRLTDLEMGNQDSHKGTADPKRTRKDSPIPSSELSSGVSSTDSEDSTSSSGSSSDSDSGGDAPDQASSRRAGPERVLPPKRVNLRGVCNTFLKTGRCKFGKKCRYRHDLPERGSRDARNAGVRKSGGRRERIGLHQRVSHPLQDFGCGHSLLTTFP